MSLNVEAECDRCGKTHKMGINDTRHPGDWYTIQHKANAQKTYGPRTQNICDECYEAFKSWMKEKRA